MSQTDLERSRTDSDKKVSVAPDSTRGSGLLVRRIAGDELVIICGAVLVAFLIRFVIDDAYISFRYAKHLADGHGLVFNNGQRVEGYTNFLWTALLAIPFKLGLSPEWFSFALSLASLIVASLAAMRVSRMLSGRAGTATLTGVLLCTNAAFLAFGTSGLETMFQTALLAVALWVVLSAWTERATAPTVALFSVLAALAILTRLDSVVILAPLGLGWVVRRRRAKASMRELSGIAVGGIAATVVVVVPWMIWKSDYYGNVLPNTFYAKSASGSVIPMGVIFLVWFVLAYVWVGPAIAILIKARRVLRDPGYALVGATILTWCTYVVFVGGDWMNWRFLVAIMPAMTILAARAISLFGDRRVRAVIVASAVLGSFGHYVFYQSTFNVDSFATVRAIAKDAPNLRTEGEYLGRYFPGGEGPVDQVTIAVVAAGALPYFSELPTVDMIGLTDREVARHGREIYPGQIGKPGHVRMASIAYLRDHDVNLILGQPPIVHPADFADSYSVESPEFTTLFHDAKFAAAEFAPGDRVVGIPVDRGDLMLAVYLEHDRAIDAYISKGWRTATITK